MPQNRSFWGNRKELKQSPWTKVGNLWFKGKASLSKEQVVGMEGKSRLESNLALCLAVKCQYIYMYTHNFN